MTVASGQVQVEVERLGRLERHGLCERAFEVMVVVGVVGQAIVRAGQHVMISVPVHFRARAVPQIELLTVVVVSRAPLRCTVRIIAVHT